MGKIKRSFELAKGSWKILKRDKFLVIFPLISSLTALLVAISFLVPLGLYFYHVNFAGANSAWLSTAEEGAFNLSLDFKSPFFYPAFFIFYLLSYFIVFFFNCALIQCVLNRLEGKAASLRIGLESAWRHKWALLVWALISATVGLIFKIIENRSHLLGKIIASLLGAAWTVTTYFMVPVLVFEETSVKNGLKRSVGLFRNIWGEQVVGIIGLGTFFALIMITGFFACLISLGLAGYLMGGTTGLVMGLIIGFVLGVLLMLFLGLIKSALTEIYRTVLYSYGITGMMAAEFPKDIVPIPSKQL
ncbi:MAG: DUF6159 family protein [Planctomycetota bacterium]